MDEAILKIVDILRDRHPASVTFRLCAGQAVACAPRDYKKNYEKVYKHLSPS